MNTTIVLLVLAALLGLILSMGSTTFIHGRGYSYLSDDPKACVNCHIMQDQYDSWQRSSHREYTTCNSCHSPENLILKYLVKAENGLNHAYKFTTKTYNDPIKIREHNFNIAMTACLNCHGQIFEESWHREQITNNMNCTHCHKEVGHFH